MIGLGARGARAEQPESQPGQKQPFVNRIVILGNEFFSEKQLKKQMRSRESSFFSVFFRPRLDMDMVVRDIAAVRAYYHANGFLEATVRLKEIKQLEDEAFVDIIIEVVENEAMRVESVEFRNPGILREKDLSKGLLLKSGVPFNRSFLASDIYTIKKHYFEKGYLAVVVEDSVATTGRRVEIYYDIDPGPTFTIDRITIAGNAMTKASVIRKELTFKSGDVFRLSKVVETQRNLFETGLFNEANIDPQNLNPARRTVDIRILVGERKSKYIEVGFGVGNVLGSRVIGEWGDRNLFGTGRTLTLRAEYAFAITRQATSAFDDFVKFYRYDAVFGQRRVFGTKVLFAIDAFIEKDATVRDLQVNINGLFLGGRRQFGLYNELILGLSTQRVTRRTSVIIVADPTVTETRSTSNIFSANLNRNTRDFILDPKQGAYRALLGKVAGGILGGDNDFYSLTGTIQRYFAVGRGTTLALRGRIGAADAYGSSNATGVPVEERYFTGGGNSVRGYDENSLGPTTLTVGSSGELQETVVGGEAMLLTNAEIRFPLPLLARYRFSGAFFVDGGNTWESWESVTLNDFKLVVEPDEVRNEDFRYTVGLGIRYNTPIGPIRLDFGYPIKRRPGESGRFHFSLGQIF